MDGSCNMLKACSPLSEPFIGSTCSRQARKGHEVTFHVLVFVKQKQPSQCRAFRFCIIHSLEGLRFSIAPFPK